MIYHIDDVVDNAVHDVFGCHTERMVLWDSSMVPVQMMVQADDEDGDEGDQVVVTMGVSVRVCIVEPVMVSRMFLVTVEGMQHGALHDALAAMRDALDFYDITGPMEDVQAVAEQVEAEFGRPEDL